MGNILTSWQGISLIVMTEGTQDDWADMFPSWLWRAWIEDIVVRRATSNSGLGDGGPI